MPRPEPRHSGQLTPDERDAQLTHVLRQLETALDFVVARARDTVACGGRPWDHIESNFNLPGVHCVKTQINQEMWADDTLTIHVDVTQLDATGTFRSVIGPNREKFAVLFAKYDPLRVREEDEYRPNSVYRVMLFLPAGIAPASAT